MPIRFNGDGELMIDCEHWSKCDTKNAGICGAGLFGGTPSEGVCLLCDKRLPRHKTENQVSATAAIIGKKVIRAGASIAKTQLLRMDRATDAQYQDRLAVCRSCPSIRTINGSERCGPMYESWVRQGGKTCGCILKYKARDIRQTCPQSKWADQTIPS